MELRSLQFFLGAAKEKSITRAAARLYISQSALTRKIQALEEECGCLLFVRTRQGLQLTDAGLLLQERAQEMLSYAQKTMNDLRGGSQEIAGHLAVGMGQLCASQAVCKVLTEFVSLHPKVSFELRTATADDIQFRLERGSLDVGLLLEPVETALFDSFVVGQREELVLLLPADDPLCALSSISAADLAGRSLILPARQLLRQELSHFVEQIDQPKIHLSNLTGNAALMVRQGAGLAMVIQDNYSYTGVPGIATRPLQPAIVLRSILAYKKHGVMSQAATAFIQFVHAKYA